MEIARLDTLDSILFRLKNLGCGRIYYKFLQENDNSKQQIYLCDKPSTLDLIDMKWIPAKEESIPKLDINFFWISEDSIARAPKAKLIYYPNYPEVRLSGLLQGCALAPSHLMQPIAKEFRRQNDHRILFIGAGRDDKLFGYIHEIQDPLALDDISIEGKSVLKRISLSPKESPFVSNISNREITNGSDDEYFPKSSNAPEEGHPRAESPVALRFRPRARIIRTIGDRLISGPDAAVIELVKNSYDADARSVYITFIPKTSEASAEIVFSDDGHGMSFNDIQGKWMEPATSDKRDRATSPAGRKLLGSKGIGRFAAARLGQKLALASQKLVDGDGTSQNAYERSKISEIDWSAFDEADYLDSISFQAEISRTNGPSGTSLHVRQLRDDWNETSLRKLYQELRRLLSPLDESSDAFGIFLDLSQCSIDICGFDSSTIFGPDASRNADGAIKVTPFPILDACDYLVDGIFDENGVFEGTFSIRREGSEPEPIRLQVPIDRDQNPCGVAVVKLSIFDREANSVRSTAEKAGFGHLGVRDARKLLDGIAGIAIYRDNFRVRPYGDAENDWLTLDAKRVQNPSQKIGRNQVAGLVLIESEKDSNLIERSSREGLEENGSFRRLQSLILHLLSEEVEPRRRKFRIDNGVETKRQTGFGQALSQAELGWTRTIIDQLPPKDREKAQKLVDTESNRLTGYLKDLSERQAQLEAHATLGLIIGEVMHQGNTPLTFIENEVARLERWWPTIFDDTEDSRIDREETNIILNGMSSSAVSLRSLFNALNPLAGAKRGEPLAFDVSRVVEDTAFLFRSRAESSDTSFRIDPRLKGVYARGYPEDLATALTNLFDNAIYWIGQNRVDEGFISVELHDIEDPSFVTMTILDNGPGLQDKFSENVFEVGFSTKPNGTGLGLSIAREAMFRSGGDVVHVTNGPGAKFLLKIPANR